MKILLPTLLLALMLSGCINRTRKTQSTQPENAPALSAQTPEPADSLSPQVDSLSLLDSVELILAAERRMRAELVEKLERATPAEADSIFRSDDYVFSNTPEYSSLYWLVERRGLTERVSAYGELSPGDSAVIKLMLQSGIAFEDVGEGYVEPLTESHYYYNIFEPYLTPETRLYARLMSDQDIQLSADAGLWISLNTLYEWCLDWEAFLNDYPHTVYRPQIGEQYKLYMENILFCTLDNTPTFESEWNDNGHREYTEINNDTLEQIRKLTETGKGSRTHQIIMQYLSELSAGNNFYSEGLRNRISALYAWPETTGGPEQAVSNEK